MATTYILYSKSIDKYYIGSTSGDVIERLKKHLSNHRGFTGKAKDWELVFSEDFDTLEASRKREFQIKKWKSREMISILIRSQLEGS